MSLNSLRYVLKETLSSLYRNTWMSLASMLTVGISLVVLGLALVLVFNTNQMATHLESDIEISTFLRMNQTPEQVLQTKAEIEKLPAVRSVELVTKEQLYEKFRGTADTNLLNNLAGANPLPDKLTVKVQQPQQVKPIAEKIGKISSVEKVNYGQGWIERLLTVTNWVRWIGFGIIGLLGLASIVLISITIKLTVFARRTEIQIMKFVGATDWFIRWPFLAEGIVLGFAGALIATLTVVSLYGILTAFMRTHLAFIPLVDDPIFMRNLIIVLLGSGTLIGALGSMTSLRKFLRV